VIARYNEDIGWTKGLNVPFFIYNKGEALPREYHSVVEYVENKGREGETWLRYIMLNYHNLPDEIAFLQGNPHFHFLDVENVVNNMTFQDTFPLGDILISDKDGCPHHCGLTVGLINKELSLPDRDMFEFAAGAQYIVPKKNIINKPPEWWINAYNIYMKYEHSPWIFERLWKYIFS